MACRDKSAMPGSSTQLGMPHKQDYMACCLGTCANGPKQFGNTIHNACRCRLVTM